MSTQHASNLTVLSIEQELSKTFPLMRSLICLLQKAKTEGLHYHRSYRTEIVNVKHIQNY